jgi:hypothetical protein
LVTHHIASLVLCWNTYAAASITSIVYATGAAIYPVLTVDGESAIASYALAANPIDIKGTSAFHGRCVRACVQLVVPFLLLSLSVSVKIWMTADLWEKM